MISFVGRAPVILNLKGGLANQFYAYAAFKSFTERYSLVGQLNISSFTSLNPREFLLPQLLDKLNFTDFYQTKIISKPYLPYMSKLLARSKIFQRLYRQLLDDDCLDSHFEYSFDSKYIMDLYYIRHLSIALSNIIKPQSRFSNSEYSTVALHIRLGDYLTAKNKTIYPTVNKEYIQTAIDSISSRHLLRNNMPLSFHIFSDSPDKAMEIIKSCNNINLERVQFLASDCPIVDLINLSSYPLKILSASSFSLLSFYIGSSYDTILPSNWFFDRPTPKQLFPPIDYNGNLQLIPINP